jgi:hypothetical protein
MQRSIFLDESSRIDQKCFDDNSSTDFDVNAVLLQPHWRHNQQQEPREALAYSNQKDGQK